MHSCSFEYFGQMGGATRGRGDPPEGLVFLLCLCLAILNCAQTTRAEEGETSSSAAFCEWYRPGIPNSVVERRLCGLELPEDKVEAMLCQKVTASVGRDVMEGADCFKGTDGEELYQYMVETSPAFAVKFQGECDRRCREEKLEAEEKLEEVEEEVDTVLDGAIDWTKKSGEALEEFKELLWASKESNNDRDGIRRKLVAKIEDAGLLDVNTKKHLVDKVNNAMEFGPEWTTRYEDIVASTNAEIGALSRKKIDLLEKKSYLKKKLAKTKQYLKSQSKTAIVGKIGSAMGSVSTAIGKFASNEPKNIVSGILDVTTAISEFLPPPGNAIMGPICSIFNGIFGIGGGPSVQDVIKDELKKQKKYLKGEFKMLNDKIDANQEQLLDEFGSVHEAIDDQTRQLLLEERRRNRKDSIDELVAEQTDTRFLLEDLLAYLGGLRGDDGLTKEAAQIASSQLTPALTGSKSGTGGKTEAYLNKYCKGRQAGDLSVAKSCIGLLHSYSMTFSLRVSVLARFIALLRASDLDKKLVEANAALLNVRRRRMREFLDKFLQDETSHCDGGFLLYGCLASGEMLKPEISPFNSYGGSYQMPTEEKDFFVDLSESLGEHRPFPRCADRDPALLRGGFSCRKDDRTLLVMGGYDGLNRRCPCRKPCVWVGAEKHVNTVEMEPKCKNFLDIPPLPEPMYGFGSTFVGDGVLICGGYRPHESSKTHYKIKH